MRYVSTILTVVDKTNTNSTVSISTDALDALQKIMWEYKNFIEAHKLSTTYAAMHPETNALTFTGKNFSFHATITPIPSEI